MPWCLISARERAVPSGRKHCHKRQRRWRTIQTGIWRQKSASASVIHRILAYSRPPAGRVPWMPWKRLFMSRRRFVMHGSAGHLTMSFRKKHAPFARILRRIWSGATAMPFGHPMHRRWKHLHRSTHNRIWCGNG